jgi:hypothetical protein
MLQQMQYNMLQQIYNMLTTDTGACCSRRMRWSKQSASLPSYASRPLAGNARTHARTHMRTHAHALLAHARTGCRRLLSCRSRRRCGSGEQSRCRCGRGEPPVRVQLFISMDLETAMNACMLGLEVVHIPWWADASVKLKQRVRQQTNKHTHSWHARHTWRERHDSVRLKRRRVHLSRAAALQLYVARRMLYLARFTCCALHFARFGQQHCGHECRKAQLLQRRR